MIEIIRFERAMRPAFDDMFVRYFIDDLDAGLSEEVIRTRVCSFILDSCEKGIVRIVLAHTENQYVGFGVFQIDRPESDWCKRPGWGFIREFYVDPAHRRRGVGRALCARIEQRLREMGATQAYLTSEAAATFWQTLGYADSGERTAEGALYLKKKI